MGDIFGGAGLGFGSLRADVRSGNDVRMLHQVRGAGRLGGEHIQRSTRDLAGIQGGEQGGFVHDAAAGGADNADAVFHFREGHRADQVAGVNIVGQMERNEVGPLEQFLKGGGTRRLRP